MNQVELSRINLITFPNNLDWLSVKALSWTKLEKTYTVMS